MSLIPLDVIKHIFKFVECPDKLKFNVLSKRCYGYFNVCSMILIRNQPSCCTVHFNTQDIQTYRCLKAQDKKEIKSKRKKHDKKKCNCKKCTTKRVKHNFKHKKSKAKKSKTYRIKRSRSKKSRRYYKSSIKRSRSKKSRRGIRRSKKYKLYTYTVYREKTLFEKFKDLF
jgi:hypothetical protein